MKNIKKSGDTIIEVLVAITIIGFSISSAFAAGNRITRLNQLSRERATALKLAEEQIETLKYVMSKGDTPELDLLFNSGTKTYCLNPSDLDNPIVESSETDDYTKFCDNQGDNKFYRKIVSHDIASHTFTVKIDWVFRKTTKREQVTLVYKGYRR